MKQKLKMMTTLLALSIVFAMSGAAQAATFTVNNTGDNRANSGLSSLFSLKDFVADTAAGRGIFNAFAEPMQSSSFVVNTLADHDDGACNATDCTLREAVKYASAGDAINFSVTGTITLMGGEIAIAKNLTITGPASAPSITVSGNNASRIFAVTGGTVALSQLTLSGGNGVGSGTSGDGGAIYNSATLSLSNCVLSGNVGPGAGGAVYNGGTLSVTGSTFSGNGTTGSHGGAIFNYIHSSASISNSTLSGNRSLNGGALFNFSTGSLTLTNSTLFGNSGNGNSVTSGDGGGLYNSGGATVLSCTIVGNSSNLGSGGGIYNANVSSSGVNLSNSIVAGNKGYYGGADDLYGASFAGTIHGDYNFVQTPGNAPNLGSHSIIGLDPQLGALANNGGPTQTMALTSTSQALNAGDPNYDVVATPNDQRGAGYPRKVGSAVDIGAFESAFTNRMPTASNTSLLVSPDVPYSGQLLAADRDAGDTLTYTILTGTLPTGLTLDTATGIISGTTGAFPARTLTFKVTDSQGADSNTATATLGALDTPSLVVNTNSDVVDNSDGVTSLREAVAYANSGNAGANPVITFSVTGIIELKEPSISITRDMTINGPGASTLTISGNGNDGVSYHAASLFNISGGIVGISGLTLSNGTGTSVSNTTYGGAIYMSGGTATVTVSVLSNNNANKGGAIYVNGGSLTVAGSTISNNNITTYNSGGGIYVGGGSVMIMNSTISDNTAGFGAGIYSGGGTLNITNSTISSNTAQNYTQPNTFTCNYPACPSPPPPGYTCSGTQCTGYDSNNGRGGGIYNAGGTVFVTNSTISGNKALGYSTLIDYGGGGIDNRSALKIANSTITNNFGSYGGGIQNRATLNLSNSIVAGNTATYSTPDIYNYPGGVTSGDYNLVQNGDTITGTNNITGQDAKLGVLANNGGPTQTHALLAGSPAIDAGDPSFDASALPYDQRGPGFPRVQNGRVDIGAYEADIYQSGSSFVVNTLADHDDGNCGATDCTLREAVNNALAGTIITFSVTGTITLTNGNIITAKNLTINGPTSSPGITVSGNNASRIFTVTSGGALNLSTLTFSGGNGVGGGVNSGNGGALAIDPNATATVTNCTFSGNNTPGGTGGAIRSGGTVTVTNSIFSGNTAGAGGAIRNNGTLTVTSSTFSGNSSTTGGGGIYNNSKATLMNSTVSGNTAGTDGGGIIINGAAAQLTLTSVTVAFNTATSGSGGGVNNINGTATLRNTLVAKNNNSTAPDFSGAIASTSSFNLIGDGTGMTGIANDPLTGNQVGASGSPIDPKLDPTLALNGGTTPNHALLLNSPAIDQGSDSGGTDQRGNLRPVDLLSYTNSTATGANAADIGAYELQPADLTIVKSHTGNFTQGQTGAQYTITVTNGGESATGGTVTVTDTLPTGLTATAITGTGWTCSLGTLSCTRSDSLAAGASYPAITLTINVAGNAPSSVTNTAAVSGGGETNAANNTANDVTTINSAAARYTISGQVTNGGQGLSGVTVTLSGGSTTTTDAAGNYSFTNLTANGNYTVTPSMNGYTFVQPSATFNNLSANQSNANFATSAVTYEGDVATRPTGDGSVDVFDLVAVGRIIALLDAPPADGSEFQRADAAPRTTGGTLTLGDNFIDVLDLVQIGRYSAVLDPLTPAGGPTKASPPATAAMAAESYQPKAQTNQSNELASALSVTALSATISAGSVTASSTAAAVPIQLTTTGNVEAIQFSITYDQTKLALPANLTTAFTNRYPNTTFTFNTATPGQIGVVAYQPLDGVSVFPAGAIKLFDINFTVIGTPSNTTPIDFGNLPIPQRASDPTANAVTIVTTPGTIMFLGPTAATVSVGGRVTTQAGRGIRNVVVTMTDMQGNVRTALTTNFGYYRFEEVASGETYVFAARGKHFFFEQNSQVHSIIEDTNNINFIANDQSAVRLN